MDRQLSPKEKASRRRKLYIKTGAGAAAAVALLAGLFMLSTRSVSREGLTMIEVTEGPVQLSVTASGRVIPAYEQTISSPISSRIVEIYAAAGDTVAEGTPLLRLDLGTAETELSSLADQRAMKQLEMEQGRLADHTSLSDLEMRIAVKEMEVSRLKAEYQAEQRLDSLGSGTGEKVRQAEAAWRTGTLELAQLRRQSDNERRIRSAADRRRRLDMSVFDKELAQKQRTLDDARIRAPRAATVTMLVNEVGRQVGAGEKLAVIADLTRFKIDGSLPDSYANRMAAGAPAIVKVGRSAMLQGHVTTFTPQSNGGVIAFTVELDNPSDPALRSGLSTEVYILSDLIEGAATRLPFGSYYTGPGTIDMWVLAPDGESLDKRRVTLGEAGYRYVEVVSGLRPGEKVVTSDMRDYAGASHLNVK